MDDFVGNGALHAYTCQNLIDKQV